ncbi:MAG: hypothetical protein A2086_03250 [Spirochaetes bacterium GWD1_27_9]|nr:MAG: hypothetical protein A2Z98_12925 [Spirochaetes bacterium GWB1_27_13]OHD26843.1 MAG: hypothetical protein A2Y34_15760 [Spirochaetes bacterium GWC1_27_15]OHD38714.1 MAG: hypothetical protein A2086_03250 [Spirochaetes bacterium GWD1_27_9]
MKNPLNTFSIACPRCLEEITQNTKICPKCRLVLSDKDISILAITAEGISLWAWEYGIPFYNEYKETGKIVTRFCLEPLGILSYLASVVAAGVIGNLAYDLIKEAAIRIIKKIRNHPKTTIVIDPKKSDEENLKILFKLTKMYVDYYKTPFGIDGEFAKVFSIIELSEPGKFLSPGLLLKLEKIYSESDLQSLTSSTLETQKLDYLTYVYSMTHHVEENDKVLKYLSTSQFTEANNLLSKGKDGQARLAKEGTTLLHGVYNVSRDRYTRGMNFAVELIENSIMALQHIPNARLSINIAGNECTIEDNGPGMSPYILFDVLLLPEREGWIKYGILKENEVSSSSTGVGFVTSLLWCDKVIVESKAAETEMIAIEILIKNMNDIQLFRRPNSGLKLNQGTKIYLHLCEPPRMHSFSTGPISKVGYQEDLAKSLIMLIRSYCGLVENRIAVYLNGELVNDEHKRGIGPNQVSVKFSERFREMDNFINKDLLDIPIYFAQLPESTNMIDYYSQNIYDHKGFKAVVEYYHYGLFQFYTILSDQTEIAGHKIEISDYQKYRLNHLIIRVFLPGHFPLLIGRQGLPMMSEYYIIKQILSLIFPKA